MTKQTQLRAEKGTQEFFITREFDAPPEVVFRAFSEPELLLQWWLPKSMEPRIESMDCRTGGNFHFTHQGADRAVFGFRGVYHEVVPAQSIVKTSEFTGLPQKVDAVLEYTSFERTEDGRTKVTLHTLCPSVAYRDNMIAAQMKQTFDSIYEALDTLLQTFPS